MAYYEPGAAATTFSLFARQGQTLRERREEEKRERDQDIATYTQGSAIPLRLLEGKRAGDIADAQILLSQRDPRTATGRKFKPAEYIAPERRSYDPRRLKDWLGKRYARSGEERVTRETIVKPGDPKKSEIFESGVPVSMAAPEGNRAYMEKYQDRAFYRDFDLHKEQQRKIEAQQLKETLGARHVDEGWGERYQRKRSHVEDLRQGRDLQEAKRTKAIEDWEKKYTPEYQDTYKKELERLRGMPRSGAEVALGITDSPTPSPLGDITRGPDLLQRPGNLMEQVQAGYGTEFARTPQVDPSKYVGTTDISKEIAIGKEAELTRRKSLEEASSLGKKIEGLKSREEIIYPELPPGYSRPSVPGGATGIEKTITKVPSDQPISDVTGYENQPYRSAIAGGNYAVDTLQSDLKEMFPGKDYHTRMGKELIDKAATPGIVSEAKEFGSFHELVGARSAAEKGSDVYKSLQGQINELYKKGGGTYEGAAKAFDAVDVATDIRKGTEVAEDLASTVKAVDVGSDVVGAAGAKTVPGLGDLMTAVEMFDKDKSEEEKLYDAVSTGVGFVPGGQPLAAGMKLLKAAYGMRHYG